MSATLPNKRPPWQSHGLRKKDVVALGLDQALPLNAYQQFQWECLEENPVRGSRERTGLFAAAGGWVGLQQRHCRASPGIRPQLAQPHTAQPKQAARPHPCGDLQCPQPWGLSCRPWDLETRPSSGRSCQSRRQMGAAKRSTGRRLPQLWCARPRPYHEHLCWRARGCQRPRWIGFTCCEPGRRGPSLEPQQPSLQVLSRPKSSAHCCALRRCTVP
jgi:hypothetical protein